MSMKALLAVLDHRAPNRALMETACAFTARWQAKLKVFLPYPGVWNPGLISIADETVRQRIESVVDQVRRQEEEFVESARQEFEGCCRRQRILVEADETAPPPAAHWEVYTDFDRGNQIVRQARLADLVFVQRPIEGTSPAYVDLVNDLLDGSARPLMVVPPRPVAGHCDRVAIAWNGSAESARAVSAALSLITEAAAVDILIAESPRTPGAAGHKLSAYLACHGISARRHVMTERRNRPAGQVLLDKCAELGSDVLVMGAYTHTRLQERLLGGVTRHMLAHAELPVVMAH